VTYVDGYVIPMPRSKVKQYAVMSKLAAKVWMDHGALRYCESVGEDLAPHCGLSFAKANKLKRGETVVFSYVSFKSRKHRDAVNAKVMADPRVLKMMKKSMPFDGKRMVYGGFTSLVEK
jgi:uncharacterized protein YbaA (DUF1428 family)